MSRSQDPIASLLNKLQRQIRDNHFSEIAIQRFEREWLKVDLKREERILWIGYETANGFFITLDRDLPPRSFFRLDSELNQTASLILGGLLPPSYNADMKAEVNKEVEKEIKRLQAKIKVQEHALDDENALDDFSLEVPTQIAKSSSSPAVLAQLVQYDDSPVVLTRLAQSSGSPAVLNQLGQADRSPMLSKGVNVIFDLGGQQYLATLTTENKGRAIRQVKKIFSKIPIVYSVLRFILKPFRSLLRIQPKTHLRNSTYKDISALQTALEILSKPAFKKAICGSISEDLDLIFKKVVDVGVPTGIVAAAGAMAMSISGVSITPTGIALIALIISRASVKVYCDSGN
jgi:hypothetical protein